LAGQTVFNALSGVVGDWSVSQVAAHSLFANGFLDTAYHGLNFAGGLLRFP